jgi:SNF2 family DNA or RNA helicase
MLVEVDFDYAILDESQAVKNHATQASKAARALNARHRLALSGTPLENHLTELWSLFEFLNPGMLGRSTAFRRLTRKGGGEGVDREGRALLARALRPFLLRRTKEQVAKDLPEKTEQTLHCEMPARQRRLYRELASHYRESLLSKGAAAALAGSRMHVLEALLRLRQAACHPGLLDVSRQAEEAAKLDALLPLLEEVIEEGHKALVFSQFTSMLAIVRDRLEHAEITYEYLDGQTRNRKERVDRFQSDDACPVFLISLKAGGLGLNLTAADYVFILDPWWNPAVEAQAIDRTYRIGQTRHVMAYRLVCKDTVEEKILKLQERKRDLADAILTSDNAVLSNLRPEDLELLLS